MFLGKFHSSPLHVLKFASLPCTNDVLHGVDIKLVVALI